MSAPAVILKAFSLVSGRAYRLDRAGRVWCRRPGHPWAVLGTIPQGRPEHMRPRALARLEALDGPLELGRVYRPAPPARVQLLEIRSGVSVSPDGCLIPTAAACPHGFRSWPFYLGLV